MTVFNFYSVRPFQSTRFHQIEASGMSAWEQSNPENAILEAVKSAKPDLLVLGHTGQKSIVEKMLSHSVAKYLVDNAPCPVLVVKAKWDV